MKRKHFIKQLMAAGVPRNSAATAAQRVQASGRSYFHELGRRLNALAVMTHYTGKALMGLALYGQYDATRFFETIATIEGVEIQDGPVVFRRRPYGIDIGHSIVDKLTMEVAPHDCPG